MESKQLSMKNLGIDPADITVDLSKYYEKIYKSSITVSTAQYKYGSVEDYVNVLYWIKFVKKMHYKEMGEFTGKHDFYQIYATNALFWHYETDSLEECERLYQEELSALQVLRDKAKDFPDEEMPQEYNAALLQIAQSSKKSKARLLSRAKKCGHSSIETLLKEVFYLRFIEKLTTKELAILYDESTGTTSHFLRQLNCNLSQKEAQQRVVGRGRRNYDKVFATGRKTHTKQVIESGLTGSNIENAARIMINDELLNNLGHERFEVVVGITNRGIVGPAEVDIPIIVIDKATGKVSKFAVEYNGTFWHKRRKEYDKDKEQRLKELGWTYHAIVYVQNSADVTDQFMEILSNLCKTIANEVLDDSLQQQG